jgi:hypothetical protein
LHSNFLCLCLGMTIKNYIWSDWKRTIKWFINLQADGRAIKNVKTVVSAMTYELWDVQLAGVVCLAYELVNHIWDVRAAKQSCGEGWRAAILCI